MSPSPRSNSSSAEPVEIRAENVHKSFGANHVLRGIDLEIRRGEMLAIVGGSGSGKTVLLDHLIGLQSPDRGRILVADHSRDAVPLVDLAKLNSDALDRVRVHWAVVFQSNALYSGTVFENLAFWLREHTDLDEQGLAQRVRDSLDAVGFKGDEDIVRKRRDELSGGMAKRVAVARAIAMDPAVIFYDEPTTGLDPSLAGQIQELIAQTHHTSRSDGGSRTSIFVTHDRDLLRRLRPRVVMLHSGTIHFDGPYDAFEQCDSEAIRPYFHMMADLHRTHAV